MRQIPGPPGAAGRPSANMQNPLKNVVFPARAPSPASGRSEFIKFVGRHSKSCISAGRTVTAPRQSDGDAFGALTGCNVDYMETPWKTKQKTTFRGEPGSIWLILGVRAATVACKEFHGEPPKTIEKPRVRRCAGDLFAITISPRDIINVKRI